MSVGPEDLLCERLILFLFFLLSVAVSFVFITFHVQINDGLMNFFTLNIKGFIFVTQEPIYNDIMKGRTILSLFILRVLL